MLFDKDVIGIHCKKADGAGAIEFPEANELILDLSLTSYTKVNSKWI